MLYGGAKNILSGQNLALSKCLLLLIFSYSYFQRTETAVPVISEQSEKKKGSKGGPGVCSRGNFLVAMLVFFEQLFEALSFRFLPLILTFSPSMKHFCPNVIHLCMLNPVPIIIIIIEEIQICGKIVSAVYTLLALSSISTYQMINMIILV